MQVSRQKSGTPVKDEKLIVPILFFAEWGFMDYVAARLGAVLGEPEGKAEQPSEEALKICLPVRQPRRKIPF